MDALAAMLAEMPRPSTHKAVATRWVPHLPARPVACLSTPAHDNTQMQTLALVYCAQLRMCLPPHFSLVTCTHLPLPHRLISPSESFLDVGAVLAECTPAYACHRQAVMQHVDTSFVKVGSCIRVGLWGCGDLPMLLGLQHRKL